jgi:hypothetical protein
VAQGRVYCILLNRFRRDTPRVGDVKFCEVSSQQEAHSTERKIYGDHADEASWLLDVNAALEKTVESEGAGLNKLNSF